jgi:hypothetical protein
MDVLLFPFGWMRHYSGFYFDARWTAWIRHEPPQRSRLLLLCVILECGNLQRSIRDSFHRGKKNYKI